MAERMTRRLVRMRELPAGQFPLQLRCWRLGDAVWVLLEGEYYNVLQRELRARFPRTPLVFASLANGSRVWYVPARDAYGKGLYQEDASVVAAGTLERILDALCDDITKLLEA